MANTTPESLLKLIRERQSSVIRNLLRQVGSPINNRHMVGVLARYEIDMVRLGTARKAALSLCPAIRWWAGKYYRAAELSGSIVKGTAVLGTTDVDLFISLAHDLPDELCDIYQSLFDLTNRLFLTPRPQNVSIRVRYQGVEIDLVPGKRQPGAVTDHSIYSRKTGKWTKTNVQRHILYVKGSGRIHEIRATKIWRMIHGLEFPTFPLELAVIEALRGQRTGAVVRNFYQVLHYLAYRFPAARLVDPANKGNVVSDGLTASEKQAITAQAQASLTIGDLRGIIW